MLDQREQRLKVAVQQGFAGHEQQAGALLQFLAKPRQVVADDSGEACLVEQHHGDLTVAPERCKNDRSLGRRFMDDHGLSSPSRGLLAPR
ncbi:hypothetical protein D3C73_1237060 [compost metagenome]